MCATVGFADVTSANIVGYETAQVYMNKYVALAVQFENVDQTDIPVKDLIQISDAFFPGAEVTSGGDQIWKWDSTAGDWIKYYYRGGRGVAADKVGWTKDGEDKITTDKIAAGETAFFKRAGADATVTLAGGVKLFTGEVVTECAMNKYSFLAYPWPMAMKITDFTSYIQGDPFPGAEVTSGGDQIWLWDSTAGDWIKYYYRGGRGVAAEKVGWTKDGEDKITTESIPSGLGFFFKRAGATVDVKFTCPTK